jgi:hypothetical protein
MVRGVCARCLRFPNAESRQAVVVVDSQEVKSLLRDLVVRDSRGPDAAWNAEAGFIAGNHQQEVAETLRDPWVAPGIPEAVRDRVRRADDAFDLRTQFRRKFGSGPEVPLAHT